MAQIQPERALECIFAGRYEKKSRYYLPSHASAIPFFDLLRLFYRFSCSKITQLFCLLSMRLSQCRFLKKPMVLVILDGYGYREEQQDNAILNAKTPVMDALWAKRPHTLIDASGLEVGLPDRQMGNSEVGHVNLGAGRIVYQDLTRLDVEIKERTFFANPVLTNAVDQAKNAGKAVHIMGLLSAGVV